MTSSDNTVTPDTAPHLGSCTLKYSQWVRLSLNYFGLMIELMPSACLCVARAASIVNKAHFRLVVVLSRCEMASHCTLNKHDLSMEFIRSTESTATCLGLCWTFKSEDIGCDWTAVRLHQVYTTQDTVSRTNTYQYMWGGTGTVPSCASTLQPHSVKGLVWIMISKLSLMITIQASILNLDVF